MAIVQCEVFDCHSVNHELKYAAMCRVVARAADAHRLNQAFSETPFDGFKFEPITEHQVNMRLPFRNVVASVDSFSM